MSGYPKLDVGVAATSTVLTADQLMRALEASHEGKEGHAKKHLGYAALGAAVAVGALELYRRDEQARKELGRDYDDDHHHHRHPRDCDCGHCDDDEYDLYSDRGREVVLADEHHGRGHSGHHRSPRGHKRRLAEEIMAVYALGEELMGNKKHHVAHLVAEALGAVAAYKDTRDHSHGEGVE